MSKKGLERFKSIFWKIQPIWIAGIIGIVSIVLPSFILLESESPEVEGVFFNLPLVIYYDGAVAKDPLWVPPGPGELMIGTAGVLMTILLAVGGGMALAVALISLVKQGKKNKSKVKGKPEAKSTPSRDGTSTPQASILQSMANHQFAPVLVILLLISGTVLAAAPVVYMITYELIEFGLFISPETILSVGLILPYIAGGLAIVSGLFLQKEMGKR